MVINQVDLAEKRGLHIDSKKLSELLGQNILETNAKKNIGIEKIRESIFKDEFSTNLGRIFAKRRFNF